MENLENVEEKILKIECTLDRIFYPKYVKRIESGSFGIFKAMVTKCLEDTEYTDEYIKLKGNCPTVEYGTTYKVYCKLSEHNEVYGDTYELVYISKCIDISSKDKQKEFLKNILNENLVDKLFDEYDDVIKLLEDKDVKSLMKIKGIGNQVALRMIDEYEESKDYSAIYMELGKLGMTHTFIKKLVDFYRSPDTVIDVVRNNPYDLVRVEGVGFKKADEVACKVGVGQFDIRRIKGFLLHHLNEQGEAGKSYLYYHELMKALYDTLGFVPEDVVNSTAKLLIENNDVVVTDNGNKISLKKYYDLEKNIMNELMRLQIGRIEVVESEPIDEDDEFKYIPKQFHISQEQFETNVKKIEESQGFDFTDEQRNAIKLGVENNVITITGSAGTGKSATANGILNLFPDANVVACALSGKAAVRITEATGLDASTIHRALGYSNDGFTYNKYNKLPADVVLLDEATMVNGTLFLSLLEAIESGAHLIVLGDIKQLQSLGNCQVYSDILNANMLPCVTLTKIHRQAQASGIITTSLNVASQEQIFENNFVGSRILGELQDMELDISGKETSIAEVALKHFQKEMLKVNNILEVQVIAPMRLRGSTSCYELNTLIQDVYNPKFKEGYEIEILLEKKNEDVKKYIIREGDKVINVKNNYNCRNTNGDTTPVFNGNIGIVKSIDKDRYTVIDFVGIGEVVFTKDEVKNLELAYCCTGHKMQGSSADSVIVVMDNSSYVMNTNELLYTNITRAKKYCVLCGVNSAIRGAIQKKEARTKQTFLKDMLLENKHRLYKEVA